MGNTLIEIYNLTGVILEIRSYWVCRLIKIFQFKGIIIIDLFGGVLVSILCVCQMDIKSIIAYSSVAHMRLVLARISSIKIIGLIGGMIFVPYILNKVFFL